MIGLYIRLTSIVFIVATIGCQPIMAQETVFETAAEAVKNMRVGWNLGNTLESNSGDTLNMWIEHWTDRTPAAYEAAWGQTVVDSELFQLLKEAGFNAVRVPVTWYPHMEAKFKFNSYNNSIWYPSKDDIGTQVQADWMQRVKQIVDYIISQDMYCILNVHHDTGASNTAWLIADESTYARQRERFEAIWRQISEEFKDYGERLLFEGYNEMLDVKRSWCFASFGATGNYNAAIAKSAYNAINSYAQSFVNAVRSTGGNNAQRNLVVCTYGACDGSGTWSSHLQDPLKEMKLPEDVTPGHLFFEVHHYPKIKNLDAGKAELSRVIRNLNNYLVSKGAPVIIGEWGSSMEKESEAYEEELAAFDRFFMAQTKANNIATFHWMGISEGADRTVPKISEPELVEAMMEGYYGEGGYQTGIRPTETLPRTADVYTVTGIKLTRQAPAIQRPPLPGKGIYIVNGRKKTSK